MLNVPAFHLTLANPDYLPPCNLQAQSQMPAILASGSLSARPFAFLLLASVLASLSESLDGVHLLAVGCPSSVQRPPSTASSQCRIAIDRNFRLSGAAPLLRSA